MKLPAVCKYAMLGMLIIMSGCSHQPFSSLDNAESHASGNTLPNWYHSTVGFQVEGGQDYPDQPALARLLMDADTAFMNDDLDRCQILLERAQRIATRESGVYVRLSYLYWVQNKPALAEQMSRRALAVLGNHAEQRQEVERLLYAIQNR